jgi:hypothetical protein
VYSMLLLRAEAEEAAEATFSQACQATEEALAWTETDYAYYGLQMGAFEPLNLYALQAAADLLLNLPPALVLLMLLTVASSALLTN